MVDAGAVGGSYGSPTQEGLFMAKAPLAFCTEDYGEKTGAGYETYEELRYAHQHELKIIAIQLSETFPPMPKGNLPGQAQNSFILKSDRLRSKDVGMNDPERVADDVHAVWNEMNQESSGYRS